jgi:hypothetical protein
MTDVPGGDFVVGPPNAKDRWSVVAMAAGLTAVCVALAVWGRLPGLIVGSVGTVFFGLIGIPVVLLRAVHPQPALVVGADGFTINQDATDLGFISWDEVASIGAGPLAQQLLTHQRRR